MATKKTKSIDWISVETRLPYSDQNVLIYDFSRGIQIAFIDSKSNDWIVPEYCSAVLFWMPLPEKPIFEYELITN